MAAQPWSMKLLEALWLTLGVALLLVLPGLLASCDFYAALLYFTGFTVFLVISEKKVKPSS